MANSYLYRTNGTPTRAYKGTVSHWIKRSGLGAMGTFAAWDNGGTAASRGYLNMHNDTIYFYNEQTSTIVQTNRVFRDTSAWYHIVAAWDTTQSTASDRVKIYVNGVQETSMATGNYPGQNNTMEFNVSGRRFGVGVFSNSAAAAGFFNGYQSHFAFVDGQQLTPTTFGETDSTSGIWKFKSPSGVTWGNNGFHLKFENSGNLGLDSSGNGNNLTVSGNLKQAIDNPSNNYSTCNELTTSSMSDLTQGNNTVKGNTATNDGETYSTLGTGNKGKWYWEIKATGLNGNGNPKLGFVHTNSDNIFRLQNGGSGYGGGSNSDSIMIRPDGKVIDGGSTSGVLYGTFSAGDILSFALDSDNGAFYYAINGTWQNSGNPASGASKTGAVKTWTPTSDKASHGQHVCIGTYDTATQADCNFGNGFFGTTAITSAGSNGNGSLFEYDVPSGYYALNTKNINTYG